MDRKKEEKKLFPKILRTVPSGVRNHKGKIVTQITAVKQIIMRKYNQRLRKRPSNPETRALMELKEANAAQIIKMARQIKTTPWTQEDLSKVLKSLKKKQVSGSKQYDK